jgi:hypothetical protein
MQVTHRICSRLIPPEESRRSLTKVTSECVWISHNKCELEADEFITERTVYILLQTAQKSSGAVHLASSAFADFTGPVVRVLDGDTIEVLHNQHPERIRLPQSQRHSKERRNPLNRKNGEARILVCQHLSCTFVNPHNQTRQPTEHGE